MSKVLRRQLIERSVPNHCFSFLALSVQVLSSGGKRGERVFVHSALLLTPVVKKLILYKSFLDWTEGCFGETGLTTSLGPQEVCAELSFCPRCWAHAEGCSNSSDRRALETRSSVFWSLTGTDCTWEVSRTSESAEWEVNLQVRQNLARFLVGVPPSIISKGIIYFWQKSCPQFLQWWRRSVREKRTVQPEQLSTTSSFTQWSAAERPGWSLTDQLKTRPRPSPTSILLWSLWQEWKWGKYRGTKKEFVLSFGQWFFSYLEMARDVISAGWALSLRSNAVCMVSLLLKTSWRSHLYPVGIHIHTLKQAESKNWTTKHQQIHLFGHGLLLLLLVTVSILVTWSAEEPVWIATVKTSSTALSAHLFWVGCSVVGLCWRAEKAAILSSGLD